MKKVRKGLVVLVIIALVSVVGAIFSKVVARNSDEYDGEPFEVETDDSSTFLDFVLGNSTESAPKKIKSDYIGVIYVKGVISSSGRNYNQSWILKTIKNLKADEKNHGILLFIDSPGGGVYESDETYLALEDYKNSTGKPVFAYFGSIAASGGYYIGCAAQKIYANRNCLTGSIGVIAGQTFDATELMKKIGVKSTTITAGKNKNMGNYNSVFTDEQKAIMQAVADEAYEQFTGIVASSRKMSISSVKALADGRIYTANQALKNGLIDEVCSIDDAKKLIKQNLADYDNAQKFEFIDFKYEYKDNIYSLFSAVSSLVSNPKALAGDLLSNSSSSVYYLYN